VLIDYVQHKCAQLWSRRVDSAACTCLFRCCASLWNSHSLPHKATAYQPYSMVLRKRSVAGWVPQVAVSNTRRSLPLLATDRSQHCFTCCGLLFLKISSNICLYFLNDHSLCWLSTSVPWTAICWLVHNNSEIYFFILESLYFPTTVS